MLAIIGLPNSTNNLSFIFSVVLVIGISNNSIVISSCTPKFIFSGSIVALMKSELHGIILLDISIDWSFEYNTKVFYTLKDASFKVEKLPVCIFYVILVSVVKLLFSSLLFVSIIYDNIFT